MNRKTEMDDEIVYRWICFAPADEPSPPTSRAEFSKISPSKQHFEWIGKEFCNYEK
jgi:hypothetical protein